MRRECVTLESTTFENLSVEKIVPLPCKTTALVIKEHGQSVEKPALLNSFTCHMAKCYYTALYSHGFFESQSTLTPD